MRRLLGTTAALAATQVLHSSPGCLRLGRAAALGASAATGAGSSSLWSRPLSSSPAAASIAGLGCMAAAEASFFTQHGEQSAGKEEGTDLGDLRPGMTLSEEEDDEAEHYAVRAHIHRRRLKQREEERHLDEEDPPAEEAPGEEAYKEAGPLLPPDSEEEDILSDEELEARK